MKVKQFFSAVIFGMLVSSASASTVPTTMTFTLGMGDQVNYTNTSLDSVNLNAGDVAGNGFDRWMIDLTDDANLFLNFITGQDTTGPDYSYLTKAELRNSYGDLLAVEAAVLPPGTTGISLIQMSISGLLAGSYSLDIFGASGLGYSGSVSAVPLPAAAWLFGSAALGLFGFARRRKQADVAAV